MAEEAESVTHPQIPDKLFFKIGEVAQLTGTKPHVLRYWESEFKMLRPAKGESGQRIYRRKDVELIFSIKQLLYEENFTIAGAKKQLQRKRAVRAEANRSKPKLQEESPQPGLFGSQNNIDVEWIRKELKDILDFLK
ncbi:MerR family transcriptional regulator [Nitrospinota bacterium]